MSNASQTADLIVVGGGIVGLATAYRWTQRHPDCSVTVLEAESEVGQHQSGHNSGVLHSGIYYKPNSQKAITCRQGKAAMEAFCDQHAIPWDRCGKVVVATSQKELEALDRIAQRGTANGVQFERIDTDQLREREPNAAGIAALLVPETGIVNYAVVCETLARLIRDSRPGCQVITSAKVNSIESKGGAVNVGLADGRRFSAGQMVNCGGLQSDRIARLAGVKPTIQIVPFRGEYYELAPTRESLVKHLIYPVPDPAFPFLGVHFTRMIDGGVECGPNAVLALSREGYDWTKVRIGDLAETLAFKGFRKLAMQHWKMGIGEMNRSLRKSAFVAALQRLMPCIGGDDLVRGRAGVRAQAVANDGKLVDDFLFAESDAAVHVLNAPSPAATASLAIGDAIVDRLNRSSRVSESTLSQSSHS